MITEDILKWIGTLPKWEQKLGYYLIEGKPLTESFLDEIYSLFKVEMGIEEGDIPEEITLPESVDKETIPKIIWKGVKNVHGVNKLKTGSELEAVDGLTIIYGENGSGKSGYTRLLNNAFISRGDQEILPDIYKDDPEDVSAEFKFIIDETPTLLKFPENKDEYPFRTIRNFDSKSASDDMNRESTIDFVPSELTFFDKLLKACTEIQSRLDRERETRKTENPIVKYFPNEGKALELALSLSDKTDIDKIRDDFSIDDDEKNKYESAKIEKAKLIALDINRQISTIDMVIGSLVDAQRKIDAFMQLTSDSNVKTYNQQIKLFQQCKLIHDKEGLALFEEDKIDKLGSEEWKNFIISAKKYYDEIETHNRCPLCGKEIGETDLIYKYWKYLESDVENNLNVAKEAICISKERLSKLDLSFLPETSVQKQWLIENFKLETEGIADAFKLAESIRTRVLLKFDEVQEIIVENSEIKANIQDLIDKINKKKVDLNQADINARIAECSKFETEFVEKTKINELIPIIESYIDYLKWDSRIEKSKIKPRTITNKQKELFEKYVTDDYLDTFSKECKKLHAEFKIEIASRGSNGQTLKKLQINGTAPGKVLSEGEQRAISIANFLTEVHMDSRNIGVVFDDPVCSLDHKRRSYIVDRLLEESKERQVVVFTHEITFFMELKTEAEKKGVVYQQETIRKINDEPGNISAIIPWQGMNVKDRIGKLKNDLQGITAVYNSGDEDTYYYRAKEWCELLRESWERTVEEILFNDAIQRYNPCVQTQRLKKAPFTHELYAELEQGMTECSAWCHDQARSINGKVPSLDDLKSYIDCFEAYYKKNRVK